MARVGQEARDHEAAGNPSVQDTVLGSSRATHRVIPQSELHPRGQLHAPRTDALESRPNPASEEGRPHQPMVLGRDEGGPTPIIDSLRIPHKGPAVAAATQRRAQRGQ
jgi:hypothetical protein